MTDILIICGSKSDSHISDKVTRTLEDLGILYQLEIASAHREPDRLHKIVRESNAKVFITIAGLAAALPGVVASITEKPVIGVPVSAKLGGLDALLSIVQMPKGVPVATVGIDNGQNAAYLAARILGVKKERIPLPSTYAEAGVDEEEVSRGLKTIGEYVKKSFEHGTVMQEYGHFANTVKINEDLCIALSTDGVGSKILVAEMAGRYDSIGQDCVAMNVNDLICVGITPVGFVDYLASEEPMPDWILSQIGQSLYEACKESDIPILGGETAILPDIIRGLHDPGLDLAGTAVGIAHPNELIDGSKIEHGDVILGIASNGLHSNGFSLSRKLIFSKYSITDVLPWGITVADELLRPTRIYVQHFKDLKNKGIDVKGIAHITGSGFKKMLRLKSMKFRISKYPELQPIFSLLKDTGKISWTEMFTTFNMGIGLIVIVPEDEVDETVKTISKFDEVYRLGVVEDDDKGSVIIEPYGVTISE
ncbi:MAG: phosphoribosylformylglycinamidine cyclo-ligase [Candidatus Lokiarchaeota archaeon]|nr:phosphoribosylformylglycinamidine cyclo-ligase [Candidatus Lokiarchaeota archaeon]